jgi:hypothetical protein
MLLLCAVLVAPVTTRTILHVDLALPIGPFDTRGAAADLMVALLVTTAVTMLAGRRLWRRLAATTASGIWSLLHFANLEHILELGAVVNIGQSGYLTDPTFLFGSALSPSHPILLIAVTAATTVLVWFGSNGETDRWWRWLLPAAAAMGLAVVVTPISDSVSRWRQGNFIVSQLAQTALDPVRESGHRVGESIELGVKDLDGERFEAAEASARNVLMVILEGVSGAFLPTLRQPHGRSFPLTMPELDRVAERSLSYATFVNTQRQTNRGEYALLCGNYPKLLTAEARMTELAGSGQLPCLPSVLQEAGFTTVYLQAAPLAFMLKDQFMAQAGFEQVHGDRWFQDPYNRNHWGVDDRTFFEQALVLIDSLQRGEKPWFLTMMNVGTHHRYNVPREFEGSHEPGSQAWAFEYLDRAVGAFFDELERTNVLDDTVVLITSDESQAMIPGAPDSSNALNQAWGFLIVALPSGESGVILEPHAQVDIPLSIVDFFKLHSHDWPFLGRSVFRRYEKPRAIFWGNVHLRQVGGLNVDGQRVICSEDFRTCQATQVPGDLLFSLDLPTTEATGAEKQWLHRAARKSLASVDTSRRTHRQIDLLASRVAPIDPSVETQYVFGGQFVTLPRRSRAAVDIAARLEGSPGWVEFAHNLVVDRMPRGSWSQRINTGEVLRLRYSVSTERGLGDVEARFWITASRGNDLELVFDSASLSIEEMPPDHTPTGVVTQEFVVLGP